MKVTRAHAAFYLLFVVFFLPIAARAQGTQTSQPVKINSETRKKLVERVIAELQAKYIAPEKVKDIESQLLKRLRSGAYDQADNPRQFSIALTEDLRKAANDLHLLVSYDPALERALLAAPVLPSVDLPELPPTPERLDVMRRSNYGFRNVEILRGNVGYLDLTSFIDLNYSKETAVAAMNFLANSDAIIIDVRKNPGGFINIQTFLASYFYGVDPMELLSRYHREGNVTVKEWTLREVPGKRFPYHDLYILTSSQTGSAGEGFAFILQQRKRARIIGEKTSGAGYGNKENPLGDGFVVFISVFRPFDARSGRGWQEVGVAPDVPVSADRALSVAHAEAVKNLALKSTDERKSQLSWLASLLELRAYGPKQVPALVLESYTGKYDGGKIVVSLEGTQLYFLGASGVRRPLRALADDLFVIEDTSVPPEHQARARFVKGPDGQVTELQLVIADGRSFPRTKDRN